MNKIFKQSKTYKILNFLFLNSDKNIFDGSRLLKFLKWSNYPKLSMIFFILSLICFWYETFFAKVGLGLVQSLNFASIFLIFALLFCDKKKLRSTRPVIYLLIFSLSLLLSGLFAAINGLELGMTVIGILLFMQFVLAFIVASTYQNKYLLINMALVLTVPLLLVGIFQGFWGGQTSDLWVSSSETLVDVRVFGFSGSPNVFGGLLMITSIMAFFAFLDKRKWYYLAYEVPTLVVLVLTFSRSAWLGLILGVAIALLIKNWRLVILAPFSLLALFIPSVRQRLLTPMSQSYLVDAAIDGRIWSFNSAIEIYKTAPILGTGPGSYGGETAILYDSSIYLRGIQNGYVALAYTDNQWVQILVQTGLIGSLSLAGFFISYFVNNLRQYKRSGSSLCLGALAALIALFITGLFENILEFGTVSVLVGAYLGLGNNYEK